MNGAELIRRLHEHRTWVNHRLLDAAQSLSEEALRRQMPIGQGSIWKSLLHLYAAEYVWLAALLGDEAPLVPGDAPGKIPGNQQAAGSMTSLAELESKWRELDARWQTYLASLTDVDLDALVFKVSSLQKTRAASRRGDILLHVCTHAQYTTAQVINMLRHVGADSLPDPMLITMARQEAAAG